MGRSEVRSSVGAEDKFFSSDFFGGVGRGGGGIRYPFHSGPFQCYHSTVRQ